MFLKTAFPFLWIFELIDFLFVWFFVFNEFAFGKKKVSEKTSKLLKMKMVLLCDQYTVQDYVGWWRWMMMKMRDWKKKKTTNSWIALDFGRAVLDIVSVCLNILISERYSFNAFSSTFFEIFFVFGPPAAEDDDDSPAPLTDDSPIPDSSSTTSSFPSSVICSEIISSWLIFCVIW